jgi:hypothetical protein
VQIGIERKDKMHRMNLLAMFATVVLGTTLMSAQASRTWVSGVGDDANPCSRTAPCKTFAGAISKTAAGGEIDALDPAGYGAVTITKAITIDGGGGQVASVLVSGTNGIVVQAGPSDVVILRNLRFNGIGTGINGIRFLSGKDLNVESCFIFGFTNNGIDVALNQATAASVHVINTVLKNNGQVGIRATNAVLPAVKVGVSNSFVILDTIGIEGAQHSRVVVDQSVVQNATQDGIKGDDNPTFDVQMTVTNSETSYNANGINAAFGSTITVGGTTAAYNSTCGFNGTAGTINFFTGTNRVVGSTTLCGNTTGIPQT